MKIEIKIGGREGDMHAKREITIEKEMERDMDRQTEKTGRLGTETETKTAAAKGRFTSISRRVQTQCRMEGGAIVITRRASIVG
eukprot:750246-Hanusia_phi.AAC.1